MVTTLGDVSNGKENQPRFTTASATKGTSRKGSKNYGQLNDKKKRNDIKVVKEPVPESGMNQAFDKLLVR